MGDGTLDPEIEAAFEAEWSNMPVSYKDPQSQRAWLRRIVRMFFISGHNCGVRSVLTELADACSLKNHSETVCPPSNRN